MKTDTIHIYICLMKLQAIIRDTVNLKQGNLPQSVIVEFDPKTEAKSYFTYLVCTKAVPIHEMQK